MAKILGEKPRLFVKTLTAVLILDLITKELAEALLSEKSYDPLPFLKLMLIYNRGAAFGIFSELPDFLRVPLLVGAPLIALAVTFVYSFRVSDKLSVIALGMVAGGALGNLFDRLFLGKVRDFLHLHLGDLYWPAFNLADASITLAIGYLLLRSLRKH